VENWRKKRLSNFKERPSILWFLGAALIFMVNLYLFIFFVLPNYKFYMEDLWLGWIISGVIVGPSLFLLIFTSMLVFGKEKVRWKPIVISTLALGIISLLFLSGLAYLFSKIIPSDFEPFRTITLPILIWAFTIYFISKTRIGNWLRRVSEGA
jgi:hypothetical protein